MGCVVGTIVMLAYCMTFGPKFIDALIGSACDGAFVGAVVGWFVGWLHARRIAKHLRESHE